MSKSIKKSKICRENREKFPLWANFPKIAFSYFFYCVFYVMYGDPWIDQKVRGGFKVILWNRKISKNFIKITKKLKFTKFYVFLWKFWKFYDKFFSIFKPLLYNEQTHRNHQTNPVKSAHREHLTFQCSKIRNVVIFSFINFHFKKFSRWTRIIKWVFKKIFI